MLVSILYSATDNGRKSLKIHHHNLIEVIWTTVPALILCIIAIPSFTVLYGMDEIVKPSLTIKAVGRQWYWTYEYGDYESAGDTLVSNTLTFDSNLLPDDELEQGQLRLLDVDNRMVLPVNKHIRLLTSAGDVIHSFAVPSLAVKLDAIPGRLNQTMMFIKRQGVFYGQCSELCGTGHSMMPIAVEAVQEQDYVDWVNAKLEPMASTSESESLDWFENFQREQCSMRYQKHLIEYQNAWLHMKSQPCLSQSSLSVCF
jgi:cytochrome c oxidase subunit 2